MGGEITREGTIAGVAAIATVGFLLLVAVSWTRQDDAPVPAPASSGVRTAVQAAPSYPSCQDVPASVGDCVDLSQGTGRAFLVRDETLMIPAIVESMEVIDGVTWVTLR